MAIAPGPFSNDVTGMGEIITVSRQTAAGESLDAERMRTAPRTLRVALAKAGLPMPEQEWLATAQEIRVTLTYTHAQVDQFIDSTLKMILAACQSVIDECLGIDPTHDKAIE